MKTLAMIALKFCLSLLDTMNVANMAATDHGPPAGVDNKVVMEWSAISLTHVQYPKGDFIGYILAWFSLLPFCILVSFVTLIIFRRDCHTICCLLQFFHSLFNSLMISYFCGLLLNEAVNWILKHLIREDRPRRDIDILFTEYGMPSSHAQFMYFFACYLVLFLFVRIYRNYNWIDELWKYATCVGGFICASLVAYSRVYLGYHTYKQVFCGASIGAVLGCVWFSVVQFIFTPVFPFLASSPVGELLMLRDSTLIPHVLWFEYTSSRSEARSRQRKVTARKSQ